MRSVDIAATLVCGTAAQASWWTVATAAAYLYYLMPDVKPSFWIGVVFGCGGGMSALLTFVLPARVQHTMQRTQAVVSYVVQAAATVAILVACAVAGDEMDKPGQQRLLDIVCALFFVASMASFRAQEILNGVLNTYGGDFVRWLWIGGTACALFMGCLQFILRSATTTETAGVAFLAVGAFASLMGIPAFALLRKGRHETRPLSAPNETRPLITNAPSNEAQAVTLRAWDVFVVGRVPFVCAAVDFGYMMVSACFGLGFRFGCS
jgi:hypothetical protein